ncbi:hypothetical protein AB0I72_15940 [Nocardiopsis sp. NPDC049922]|uniref:hypothetical protein n=1 Tax=Nocardiopsis sp. NPDC049922 TaxID=3155157 RepID=UPI0033C65E8C
MSVHHLDLRGATLAEARDRVRERFGPGSPLTHSTRLLLLDDTDRLVDHADAYEDALVSGRVSTVVCVAVGALVHGSDGAHLDRSELLRGGRDITTLWVDDETGVDWAAHRSRMARPHPGAPPGSRTGLYTLIDVLHLPEVFDHVVSLGQSMPESTASPGLLWVGSEIGAGAVDAALASAARDLTSRERSVAVPGPPAPTGAHLVDLVEGVGDGTAVAGPSGGEGPHLNDQDLRAWIAHTDTTLDALTRWTGPWAATTPRRLVEEDLPGLADALAAHRDEAEAVLKDVVAPRPGRTGAEPPGSGGAGAVDEEHGKALRALADRPRRVLDDRGTLADAAADLDRTAARLRPPVRHAALAGVGRAVPDDLVDAFRRPPPVPVAAPVPELLPVAFAAPLLPAVAGGGAGVAVALVVAATWVALLALTLHRLRGLGGHAATLGAHAVAAVVGTLAGTGVAALLGPAAPIGGPVAAVVGGLLGGGLGLAATAVSWSWRLRRWRAELGAERAGAAAAELSRLVDRVVREEGRLRTARTRLSDAAVAAASATRAVGRVLVELVDRLTPPPGQESEDQLESVLRADLVDLTTSALGPVWDESRTGPGRVVDRHDQVFRSATDLVDDLLDHLRGSGPHEPPPFADPGRERATLGEVTRERVARVLDHDVSGHMLQLCDPAHLALLDTGPAAPRCVRFVPRALTTSTRSDTDEDTVRTDAHGDTVWTAGAHLAGVLRLVPLRPGVVRDNGLSGHAGGAHE